MALTKPYSDHGIVLDGVYYAIGLIAAHRLDRVAEIHLAAWATAERRAAYKAAQERLNAARQAYVAAHAAHAAAPDGERTTPYLALISAQAEMEVADNEVRAHGPAPIAPAPIRVGPDQWDLITGADGDVSTARVYEWLKTQPGWANATDA